MFGTLMVTATRFNKHINQERTPFIGIRLFRGQSIPFSLSGGRAEEIKVQ